MKTTTFKKAVSYFALASVFTMAGCKKDDVLDNKANPNQSASDQALSADNGKSIEGQYIVVLNDNETTADVLSDMTGEDAITPSSVDDQFDGAIKGFTGKLTKHQIETLGKNKKVKSIEQDKMMTLGNPRMNTMSVPTQTVSWGTASVGSGDGTGKTAWVIDSGVNSTHPDLNVDTNRSRSFITGVTSFEDGYGHGTAVAGVIGAKDNNIGVVGVAANASIVALRVFDDLGRGSTSNAIKAVNHVIANAAPGDVVNMSLGGGVSATLDNAVKTAAAKGIFFAIAAGNSSVDCINTSPARVEFPNVYVVSSMNRSAQLSNFSNFGRSVKISAPGEGITTTDKSGGYGSASGTSIAAPHVAGLLLIRGKSLRTNGVITGDKDAWPDPIASK